MQLETPDEWTAEQEAMYLRVTHFMLNRPRLMQHPEANWMPDEHWETIVHNAAWAAAEFLDPDVELVMVDEQGDDLPNECSGGGLQ